jgi:hypothetical protein
MLKASGRMVLTKFAGVFLATMGLATGFVGVSHRAVHRHEINVRRGGHRMLAKLKEAPNVEGSSDESYSSKEREVKSTPFVPEITKLN